MTGTVTLWVFGLLCFVVAFAKQAASGAGISLPGPETRGARIGVVLVGVLALALGTAVRPEDPKPSATPTASSASSGPASATTSTSTTPPVAPGSTTPVSSTPAAQSTPVWSGSVGIPDITAGTDIEFDKVPPGPASVTSQTGIYGGKGFSTGKWYLRNSLSGHNLLGVWTGTGRPTGTQCSDWADTHPGKEVDVNAGTLVCLKTEDGHTALLAIASMSADDGTINATATVWAPS
jgi:hypothetical protein